MIEALCAIEGVVAMAKKLAEVEEAPAEEETPDEKDRPTVEENTKLYGKSEVLADDSHHTSTVDRASKKDRKKLSVIKMMRMK
jgi:hypothetical protein